MHKLIFPMQYCTEALAATARVNLRGLAPPAWLYPAVALLLLYAALYPPLWPGRKN